MRTEDTPSGTMTRSDCEKTQRGGIAASCEPLAQQAQMHTVGRLEKGIARSLEFCLSVSGDTLAAGWGRVKLGSGGPMDVTDSEDS